jgi:hypothetical protein
MDDYGTSELPSNDDSPGLTLRPIGTVVCGGGCCPTVYRTDRGTFVIQGRVVTPDEASIDVPAGEHLVEVPAELLESLVADIQAIPTD